jgi:hypothetical protein
VRAFVKGATAAAAGAIAGAAVVLTRSAVTDWPTVAILVGSLIFTWRFKNKEPIDPGPIRCGGGCPSEGHLNRGVTTSRTNPHPPTNPHPYSPRTPTTTGPGRPQGRPATPALTPGPREPHPTEPQPRAEGDGTDANPPTNPTPDHV